MARYGRWLVDGSTTEVTEVTEGEEEEGTDSPQRTLRTRRCSWGRSRHGLTAGAAENAESREAAAGHN